MVEHIKDVTRRLANVGYLAVAPDLYWRIGRPDPNDRDAAIRAMVLVDDRSLDPSCRWHSLKYVKPDVDLVPNIERSKELLATQISLQIEFVRTS